MKTIMLSFSLTDWACELFLAPLAPLADAGRDRYPEVPPADGIYCCGDALAGGT